MDLRLRHVLLTVASVALLPEAAGACAICFGGVDSPLLDAARLGVLAMAGITVCVLGAFGAWFVRLARTEAPAPEEGNSGPPARHSEHDEHQGR